jgi:hypothetical protein
MFNVNIKTSIVKKVVWQCTFTLVQYFSMHIIIFADLIQGANNDIDGRGVTRTHSKYRQPSPPPRKMSSLMPKQQI